MQVQGPVRVMLSISLSRRTRSFLNPPHLGLGLQRRLTPSLSCSFSASSPPMEANLNLLWSVNHGGGGRNATEHGYKTPVSEIESELESKRVARLQLEDLRMMPAGAGTSVAKPFWSPSMRAEIVGKR
ncbi:hypothetical protein ACLB2K_011615 [Fragaria x ananassa]